MIGWECSYCGAIRPDKDLECKGCGHVRTLSDLRVVEVSWGRVTMPEEVMATSTTSTVCDTVSTYYDSRRERGAGFRTIDAGGVMRVVESDAD